jgi:diguanylate cyclase (GGDEF)-like protein
VSNDDKFFAIDKSKVRVLVCDDETSIREMLAITLKEDGWNVETAENGRVGLEKLMTQSFHIVLSDIQMPEMSGIELLESAKKKLPHVEFVIMTSNATLETAVKALKSGAYDYLNKPFEDLSVVPKKLLQVSERILLRQQNMELLKRLQKASLQLKLLFEATRDLNGILDSETLVKSTLLMLPYLFQDQQTKAIWLKRVDAEWKPLGQVPEVNTFGSPDRIDDLDQFVQSFPDLVQPQIVRLETEGEITDALIFENRAQSMSEFFVQELRTSFQKVALHEKVVSMAHRDGLTGLYNHRYFQDRLRQDASLIKRQKSQLSLILMDVDHFKNYNDTHGHPAGDKLLKELAKLLSGEVHNRESDTLARYGGEEFVFLLPFTPLEGALIKAERIRAAVEAHPFEFREQQPLKTLSMSIGVATLPDHVSTPAELVEAADKALYSAKKAGRNRVVAWKATSSEVAPEAPAQEKPEEEVVIPLVVEEEVVAAPSGPTRLELESLPPPPPPEAISKTTLDDVLKDSDPVSPAPRTEPELDLSSIMSSIQVAFESAEQNPEPEPVKKGGESV